jgi:hypothetical protein
MPAPRPRWKVEAVALQRKTGKSAISRRPVASSMKSTGGVILASTSAVCSRPASGTSGATSRARELLEHHRRGLGRRILPGPRGDPADTVDLHVGHVGGWAGLGGGGPRAR